MHEDGGVVSRFFFHAAYPILKLGSRRPLQETDLPDLHERDTVCYNRAKIETLWDIEVKSGRKNLGRALFAEYIKSTWKAQLLAFVNLVARAGQAWALGMLMEQFDSGDGSSTSSNEKKTPPPAERGPPRRRRGGDGVSRLPPGLVGSSASGLACAAGRL